ncbi:MAG: ABC transporter permease [Telluria sp.]|nr:ABC transporter permease [Telluria sp.]
MNLSHKRIRFWLDGIGQAVWALRDNRLRTVLSILGIAIGVAAVMAVGTISKSGHYLIFNELETFGLKSVWIFRNNDDKDPGRLVRPGTGIDAGDIAALSSECCPSVRRFSPVVYTKTRLLVRAGNAFSNPAISGIGADYVAINNDNLSAGRSFRTDDIARHRAVVVIGPTVAEDLFGATIDVVGKELRLNDTKYTVIGLLERKSRDFLASIGSSGGQDANNRILVPYTNLHQLAGNKDIQVIQAEAIDLGHADSAVAQVINLLERRHNHRYTYKSQTMAQYITTSNRILQGVSLVGIVAASISLLVGGMGIMNIISTSVLERTREIGLRKAVGASRKHILFQFLMESVAISTIGGVCGLLLGIVASLILAWLTGFPLAPSLPMVSVALLVSVAVGLASGLYPAQRAARLHPVIALRYE